MATCSFPTKNYCCNGGCLCYGYQTFLSTWHLCCYSPRRTSQRFCAASLSSDTILWAQGQHCLKVLRNSLQSVLKPAPSSSSDTQNWTVLQPWCALSLESSDLPSVTGSLLNARAENHNHFPFTWWDYSSIFHTVGQLNYYFIGVGGLSIFSVGVLIYSLVPVPFRTLVSSPS